MDFRVSDMIFFFFDTIFLQEMYCDESLHQQYFGKFCQKKTSEQSFKKKSFWQNLFWQFFRAKISFGKDFYFPFFLGGETNFFSQQFFLIIVFRHIFLAKFFLFDEFLFSAKKNSPQNFFCEDFFQKNFSHKNL